MKREKECKGSKLKIWAERENGTSINKLPHCVKYQDAVQRESGKPEYGKEMLKG